MSNNVTSLQNAVVIPTTEQLKGIIREVVREELMEFSTREATEFNLNKESPLKGKTHECNRYIEDG